MDPVVEAGNITITARWLHVMSIEYRMPPQEMILSLGHDLCSLNKNLRPLEEFISYAQDQT